MQHKKKLLLPSLIGLTNSEMKAAMSQIATDFASSFGGKETSVSIWIYDEPDKIKLQASTSLDADYSLYYAPGLGLSGWVVQEGKPLYISELSNYSEIDSVVPRGIWLGRISNFNQPFIDPNQSFIGVPILVGDIAVGVVRLLGIGFSIQFLDSKESSGISGVTRKVVGHRTLGPPLARTGFARG